MDEISMYAFLALKKISIIRLILSNKIFIIALCLIFCLDTEPTKAEQAIKNPYISFSLGKYVGTIYNYKDSKCDDWDVPDTPSRAFLDYKNNIHLIQTHYVNREMIGPSLSELRHDCHVIYEGADSKSPSTFDNRSWLAATYTADGRKIYGIVHNEFQGHRFGKSICPSGVYRECWFNTLTSVVSHDAGRTFMAMKPRLVATIPFKASQTRGSHAGVFEPSNIFSINGHQYFTANVLAPYPFRGGNCLFRTEDISDPSAWRALRDGRYQGRSIDPYTEAPPDSERLCDPIGEGSLPWPIKNIVMHKSSRTWIALMIGRDRRVDNSNNNTGIYYSYSKNLIDWNGPHLLMKGNINKKSCEDKNVVLYPSLIDDVHGGRNFDEVSDSFYLTYVSIKLERCETTKQRDILYRKVSVNFQKD